MAGKRKLTFKYRGKIYKRVILGENALYYTVRFQGKLKKIKRY